MDNVCSPSESDSAADGKAFPVGVVIPTYNRAPVLIRCFRHLEAQTWKDFEVVVVDDGSTDDTRERVEQYARATPLNLRYVRQENSGPARARNHAIAMLRSPVCLMLGDDIFATPQLLATHLHLHRTRPEMKVAGLGLTRWSEDGQTVTPFMQWLDADGMQFAYGDLLREDRPTWKHFYTSNLSLKTAHLREHPFNESFRKAAMEDLELGYRLSRNNALGMVFLADALAHHFHPTSVAQACRRLVSVGSAAHRFGELWPEHRQRTDLHSIKGRVHSLLREERWILPRLRQGAGLLTRFWCPNPLLKRVLLLHYSLGYYKAAGCSAPSSAGRQT